MSDPDPIFTFMSVCTGHKNTFGNEPFTGQKTVVSDVGLTDCISHERILKGKKDGSDDEKRCITTRKVCDVMLPLLKKMGPCLPRTGIFLDEDDMELFELNADGTHATGDQPDSDGMKALSLATLFYGMLSFSDQEVLFQLHPNKRAWNLKGREMYGFAFAEMFDEAFSLSCAMPSCVYQSYFPHVGGGGPAVLPMFVRKGLINEMDEYTRKLGGLLAVQKQGAYPLMCLPCLLLKQIHNRFTERLLFDPDRPQLRPFTVIDLERGGESEVEDTKLPPRAGMTSRARFIDQCIERCKADQAVGWQNDLYEDNQRSYYMPRLPFKDIEIVNNEDDTYNGRYTVRWKDDNCSSAT